MGSPVVGHSRVRWSRPRSDRLTLAAAAAECLVKCPSCYLSLCCAIRSIFGRPMERWTDSGLACSVVLAEVGRCQKASKPKLLTGHVFYHFRGGGPRRSSTATRCECGIVLFARARSTFAKCKKTCDSKVVVFPMVGMPILKRRPDANAACIAYLLCPPR